MAAYDAVIVALDLEQLTISGFVHDLLVAP